MKSFVVPLSIAECIDRICNQIDNKKARHPWVSWKKLQMWTRENSPENSQVRLMGLNLGIIVELMAESKDTTHVSFSRILRIFFKYQMIGLTLVFTLSGILLLAGITEDRISGIGGLLFLGFIIYFWWFVNSGQNALMQLVEDVLTSKNFRTRG